MDKNNLVESYKNLTKLAKVSLEFNFIRDLDISGNLDKWVVEKQHNMLEIIKNTSSFNSRNSKLIANTFLNFYESLPRLYLGEGNPNNGSYLFQSIKLISDDTIELETYHSVDTELLRDIKILVDDYGRKIKADEHRVITNKITDTFLYTKIRFWWD